IAPVVLLLTVEVVIVKVPEVLPAAIVKEAGTCAAELALESVTTAPPVGAGPLKVTVPVRLLPPYTGFVDSFRTVGAGSTVIVSVLKVVVWLQLGVESVTDSVMVCVPRLKPVVTRSLLGQKYPTGNSAIANV